MKYKKHIIFIIIMLGIIVTQVSNIEKNQETMAIEKEKNEVGGIVWMKEFQGEENSFESSQYQKRIAKEILRFHILANSDKVEDQEIKLKMKDIVVKKVQELLKNAVTKEEAKEILVSNLDEIEQIVRTALKKEGREETVTAVIEKRTFPIKVYGDMVFPAGEYEALDIKLGEAKGKNWWCVMYPSLCLIDGTYQVVPEEEKEKLEGAIGEADFQMLLNGGKIEENQNNIQKTDQKEGNKEENQIKEKKVSVEYHFQLWDWITGR